MHTKRSKWVTTYFTTDFSTTVANSYGICAEGGNFISGSVANAYSAYFTTPSFGSNRQALYAENLSVGYPSVNLNGVNNTIIKGNLIIGNSSYTPASYNPNVYTVLGSTSSAAAAYILKRSHAA